MIYFFHLVFIIFIYNFLKNYLDEFVDSLFLSDYIINLAVKNTRLNNKDKQETNFEEKKESSIIAFLNKVFRFMCWYYLKFFYFNNDFLFLRVIEGFLQIAKIDSKTDLKISTLEKPLLMGFNNTLKIFKNFKIINSILF